MKFCHEYVIQDSSSDESWLVTLPNKEEEWYTNNELYELYLQSKITNNEC